VLVDRYAIATGQIDLAERPGGGAMANAEYLVQPRLKLLDESRRVVRVQNAPPDARRRPPRVLTHWHAAAPPSRNGPEPVGNYHDRPTGGTSTTWCPGPPLATTSSRDWPDEIEPTVVVRRYSNGTDLLMTSFET
jgi:hypothetical protein